MSRVCTPRDGSMSLEEIAQELGTSKSVVNNLLRSGLKKLRNQGLILTCRELAQDLERNRKGSVEWS